MPSYILTFLCMAALAVLPAANAPAVEDYRQAARASVQSYLAEHPYAAVTVGIVDSRGTHVFGFGQLKKDDPRSHPDGTTIYQIGSITKVFTTTMLAEQVVLGHMKLDDPAQKYLPADLMLPKEKGREITLEELATHHSGLPRLPQLIGLFFIGSGGSADPYAALGWSQVAQMLPSVWLSHSVGSLYEYSNLGMGLLGKALVTSTKSTDYAALVTERITKPLRMSDTVLTLDEDQSGRLAQGYYAQGWKAKVWHFGSLEGAGAIFSTTDDMLLFAAANLDLSESDLVKAMQLAQQPRPGRTFPGGQLGLGWHIQRDSAVDTSIVWHNGMTGGYSSMLILEPSHRIGIVVLSNVAASVDAIAVDIMRQLASKSHGGK